MHKPILIVTNTKEFSNSTKDKINYILDLIKSKNKEIHIFKEDTKVYSILKDNPNVSYINGLSSGADLILFNRINENVYSSDDSMKQVKDDFSDVYKRCISRNVSPDRSKAFDEQEFKSLRDSVMVRRLRFNISQISSLYQFIIIFKDTKDTNLLNSIKLEHGDGKFIYIYDCIKDKYEFFVGGFPVTESDFENIIKGV